MQQSGPLALMPDRRDLRRGGRRVADGAILTLNCLRPGKVRAGQSVLVYGASGSMGTAGVQLAKAFGAHVTAVCTARISTWCDHSAPMRSSTTRRRISPRTADV